MGVDINSTPNDIAPRYLQYLSLGLNLRGYHAPYLSVGVDTIHALNLEHLSAKQQ